MKAFQWDAKKRRYVYTESGRAVSESTLRRLRDKLITEQKTWAESLADSLADGSMSVQKFEDEFRIRLKRITLNEYLLGRGGRHALSTRDRGIIGALLKEQYRYLRGFAEAIQNGELGRDQIANRASLYFDASRYAHERGKAEAWGIGLDLPGYPGDGGTPCLARCACHWSIRETKSEIKATWKLSASAENCGGCTGRAAEWAPFVVAKPAA